MFNWFRRQFGNSPQPEKEAAKTTQEIQTTAQQAQKEPVVSEATSPESSEMLDWAKTAYQNIQQQDLLTQTASEEKTVDVSPTAENRSETTDLESIEEKDNLPENTTEEEIISEPKITAVPAWMQKSDRLETLKNTENDSTTEGKKIGQPETTEKIAFDEEFVWSAKVLAEQGRTAEEVSSEEISWLKRLRQGLGKTRRGLVNQLKSIVGKGPLNEDAVMAIEALLLQADVGIEATEYIIEKLQNKLREEALPPDGAIAYLKSILRELLDRPLKDQENQALVPEPDTLNIWLLTGVNGAGKTTTIGKLAHLAEKSGYSCMIAAADTFRAAAVEQVKIWGERSGTQVIANQGTNTDPAAVVFDAIAAAQAKKTNLLLVDTAGRLQNKKNLMEELGKIRRIIDKKAPDAKVEALLVLDATVGQNGLRQAEVFLQAAKLSGVVLTKIDGSAKGGIALAIAQQLNLPIRFVGAGEGIEDLRPFSSYEFVEALING